MPWRVLVIDDNQTFLNIADLALKPLQYEIETASSGVEGIRKVKTFNPDLIILDVMMPDMDGWQTLKHIRQLTYAPVMMLSASISDDEVDKTLRLQADEFLTKPIPFAKLRARVEALLQQYLDDSNT